MFEPDVSTSDGGVASRLWSAGLAVAVVSGVVLRWYRLGWQSLWFDEGYTAWVVSLSPGEMIRAIRVDTAPPLYYLLLRGWAGVAGHSEAGLRSLSALSGTVGLAVSVIVARRLFRRSAARAVAISAVAFSSMQVGYAHEARFYEIMSLAGIVDFYVVLKACERETRSWLWLAAAVMSVVVSLWLNNLLVIYSAALALAWLLAPGRRPARGRLIDVSIVLTLAVVAYAPWLGSARAQAQSVAGQFWIDPPTGRGLLRVLAQTTGADHAGEHLLGRHLFEALVAGVGLLLLAATLLGNRWRIGSALAAYGLLPILFLFGFSLLGRPLFIERAFIVSSLVMPLLLGLPLEVASTLRMRIPPTAWRAASAVLIGLFLLASVRSSLSERRGVVYHSEAWREVSRYAATLAGEQASIVFDANEGEMLYDFYARGGDYSRISQLDGAPVDYFDLQPPRTMRRVASEADLQRLRRALAVKPGGTVVLVSSHDRGRNFTLELLQRQRRQLSQRIFGKIIVTAFGPLLAGTDS